MFRFAHPEFLYLLAIVPLLILFFVAQNMRRRKQLAQFGNIDLLRQLMPEASQARFNVKFWVLLLAISVLIIVVAQPQFGSKLETVKKRGIELMVALDVSNSMMAQDINPSRMEKSKQILSKLIDELRDDKVGLIVFAGDAFTQLPITNDVFSAKMFLNSINPGIVSTQGTAIGAALNLASRSFGTQPEVERAVIIITDGENHEDDPIAAAQANLEKGIRTFVLGVGLPQGAPIPVSQGSSSFRKDKEGNVVVSKLDEATCQKIAQAGNGIYVRADNTNSALRVLAKEIDKMSKSEVESKVYSDYDEQFQKLAWLILFILVGEFFILERKNRMLRNVKLFNVEKKGDKNV